LSRVVRENNLILSN
jgi:hypothetical protein